MGTSLVMYQQVYNSSMRKAKSARTGNIIEKVMMGDVITPQELNNVDVEIENFDIEEARQRLPSEPTPGTIILISTYDISKLIVQEVLFK